MVVSTRVVGWFSYLTSNVVRPRTTDKQGIEGVQPPHTKPLYTLLILYSYTNLHISTQFFYTYPTLSSTYLLLFILLISYILNISQIPHPNPHLYNHSLTYYLYTFPISHLYSYLYPISQYLTYPLILLSTLLLLSYTLIHSIISCKEDIVRSLRIRD